MITHTAAGVLIRHKSAGSDTVAARWPEDLRVDSAVIEAAREVVGKQRLHLCPQGSQLLLGQPITVDGTFWGVLVLRIDKRDSLDLQGTLRLLQWGITWLQFLLYQQGKNANAASRPAELLDLMSGVLREQTLDEAAITLVNLLATRTNSQRVSFGLCKKQGIDLLAVSFSANFDRRAPAMQAVADAMLEAIEQRQDIHYPPHMDAPDLPSPDQEHLPVTATIIRSHEHLCQAAHAAGIHTLLLRRGHRILGAVTVEDKHAEAMPGEQQQWLGQALALVAPVFDLRQTASTGVGQALKSRLLTSLQRWFGPQHLFGKIAGGAVVLFLVLLAIPADYRINADAVLENTHKHVLVAPQDGYLAEIRARPGDRVSANQLLAQLDDDDLKLERRRLLSQLQQYRQEYDNALALSDRSQAAIASAQVEQADVQLRLVEQRMNRVRLTAPIDGMVVSDDISQSLGSPVKQGDKLFELAAEEGYLVQLFVDERDIAAIAMDQLGRLVLTSLPGDMLTFTVSRITPVSEVRDGRNYFRVEAELDGESALVRPGMTGSGKITAGRRSLGWIWFHDIWHWLRLALWI